jgi:hypothetical protein
MSPRRWRDDVEHQGGAFLKVGDLEPDLTKPVGELSG